MSAWRLLFSIGIRHGYFGDGWCPALRVRPTPSCERLMRRYRLLYRPARTGGEIYYDADAQHAGMPGSLRGMGEFDAFSFVLESTLPGFADCTEIDAQPLAVPGQSLYYFDNLDGASANFDGAAYSLLHPAERPFAYGALRYLPRRFTWRAEHPLTTLSVLAPQRQAPVWGPEAVAPPGMQASVSLPRQPEGRYRVSAPGVADASFYLADSPLDGAFAIASIFPVQGEGSSHATVVDADGHVEPRHYAIAMRARAMQWRYFIVSDAQPVHDDWRVEAAPRVSRSASANARDAGTVGFVRAQQSIALGNREAVMFTSSTPLRVCERANAPFAVSISGRGFAEPVALPFPDPMQGGSTRPVAAAPVMGDVAATDVYVYL